VTIKEKTANNFVGVRGSMTPRTTIPMTKITTKAPEMTIIWLILFSPWDIGVSRRSAVWVTFSCEEIILVMAPPVVRRGRIYTLDVRCY
jgi:hypothetical protein